MVHWHWGYVHTKPGTIWERRFYVKNALRPHYHFRTIFQNALHPNTPKCWNAREVLMLLLVGGSSTNFCHRHGNYMPIISETLRFPHYKTTHGIFQFRQHRERFRKVVFFSVAGKNALFVRKEGLNREIIIRFEWGQGLSRYSNIPVLRVRNCLFIFRTNCACGG